MLTYELLKGHAGILLCGDAHSLSALRDVVHEVSEKSVLIKDKEGPFLALAYDARKAVEGQRRVLRSDDPEVGCRYGVEILWPVLLLQCKYLRTSLAYFDSTKLHQAVTYQLEYLIEQALDKDFGPQAKAVKVEWTQMDAEIPATMDCLDSRGALFCAWSADERKAGLAGLMASFSPMYSVSYAHMNADSRKGRPSPVELESWAGVEWPDPRW